jgi:hypothetical protein
MSKSLVISHYNEDLSWLTDVDKDILIFLYTKSGVVPHIESENIKIEMLENIGKEQQTYFYHIVNNYDNLTDYVYFSQAKFDDHSHDFMDKLNNNFIGGLSDFNLITTVYGPINTSMYHRHINHKYDGGLNYQSISDKVFIDPWNDSEALANIDYIFDNLPELDFDKQNWVFNANGMYGTTKEKIKNFNLDFYKKCENFFRTKPDSLNMLEFAFERINQIIFL